MNLSSLALTTAALISMFVAADLCYGSGPSWYDQGAGYQHLVNMCKGWKNDQGQDVRGALQEASSKRGNDSPYHARVCVDLGWNPPGWGGLSYQTKMHVAVYYYGDQDAHLDEKECIDWTFMRPVVFVEVPAGMVFGKSILTLMRVAVRPG